VERAAEILRNEANERAEKVRRRFTGLLSAIGREGERRTAYAAHLKHFLKVTRSYLPDLFHCYDVPDLPRTNNDLEQLFGSCRYQQRRASGRRRGSEGLVVRGQVRLIAAAGTRTVPDIERDLMPRSVEQWRGLRASLAHRRHGRVLGRRFRQDPDRYLRAIEASLFKPTLPP
jgi:hypothetical protein